LIFISAVVAIEAVVVVDEGMVRVDGKVLEAFAEIFLCSMSDKDEEEEDEEDEEEEDSEDDDKDDEDDEDDEDDKDVVVLIALPLGSIPVRELNFESTLQK